MEVIDVTEKNVEEKKNYYYRFNIAKTYPLVL